MSRHRPATPIKNRPSSGAGSHSARTSRRGWGVMVAGGLLAVAILATGAWWFAGRAEKPIAALPDLAAVDPKVAEVLRKHWEQVARHPSSGEAWGWLGALLWAYDFRPQGAACLHHAEQLDPQNPRWAYYHGQALMIARPVEAIPKFQRAAQLCGIEPEAPRMRLAWLLAEQGRWEEAQSELNPLLSGKPDFAPARLLAARAAQARGDRARALELANSCTQDPRTARAAWSLLAILFRGHGDGTAAANAVRRSATASPDEGIADPFQAEVLVRRADARVLFDQVHPLLSSGRLADASPLVERLIREHSEHPTTWLVAGRLQYLRKDLKGAETAMRHHLELSPQSSQGLFQLGMILLAQERFMEAADAFKRAADLKPDFGPAYHNRGFALGRAGQLKESAASFREALRHNPEHFDAYCLLADVLLQLGDRDAAREVVAKAQALRPNDPRLKSLHDRSLTR